MISQSEKSEWASKLKILKVYIRSYGNLTSLKSLMFVVGWKVDTLLVGRSVCHNFLKGREVTVP